MGDRLSEVCALVIADSFEVFLQHYDTRYLRAYADHAARYAQDAGVELTSMRLSYIESGTARVLRGQRPVGPLELVGWVVATESDVNRTLRAFERLDKSRWQSAPRIGLVTSAHASPRGGSWDDARAMAGLIRDVAGADGVTSWIDHESSTPPMWCLLGRAVAAGDRRAFEALIAGAQGHYSSDGVELVRASLEPLLALPDP